jgi:hypothetical protein
MLKFKKIFFVIKFKYILLIKIMQTKDDLAT